MELSVKKWGNSAAVRLPRELLTKLKVSLGDTITADYRDDGVLLTVRRQYKLEELMAQCSLKASPPSDMVAWNEMVPVGREAL